jgi:hypothetical protein
MSHAQFWVFGFGRKSPAAIAEANAGLARPITQPSREIPDYAPGAVERLRARWSTAPMPTFYFGAPSVRMTMGGVAVRCNERSLKARRVVLEDHGLPGLIFCGVDAVTVRTLPQHRPAIEHLRPFLDARSELVLMHCQVMADGGAFGRALSAMLGCPVIGMDVDQVIGNQRIEGTAYRCTATTTEAIGSIDRAVLHFD